MSSPVPLVVAATASLPAAPPTSAMPDARAISITAVGAPSLETRRHSAVTGAPSGPVTTVVRSSPPTTSRRPSPPSAIGTSVASQPARRAAPAMLAAICEALAVPRNLSGAAASRPGERCIPGTLIGYSPCTTTLVTPRRTATEGARGSCCRPGSIHRMIAPERYPGAPSHRASHPFGRMNRCWYHARTRTATRSVDGGESSDVRCGWVPGRRAAACAGTTQPLAVRTAMAAITSFDTHDVRFPTSRTLDGSDAMNPDPDYSAAYVDGADRRRATGSRDTASCSRSGAETNVELAAIRSSNRCSSGPDLEGTLGDLGGSGAASSARASSAGSGRKRASCTWRSVRSSMPCSTSRPSGLASRSGATSRTCAPEQLVSARRLPLPERRHHARRGARPAAPGRRGQGRPHRRTRVDRAHPAYTTLPAGSAIPTSAWRRCAPGGRATASHSVKLKVGADLDDDRRRCRIARDVMGDRVGLAVDANQVWGVGEAIERVRRARRLRPRMGRGADKPRRHPRPRHDPPRACRASR